MAFLLNAPWIAVGFWNSAIGFIVLHLVARSARRRSFPPRSRRVPSDPVTVRTVIFMTLRNEDSSPRLFALEGDQGERGRDRLRRTVRLFRPQRSARAPDVIAAEENEFAALQARDRPERRFFYRRRADNTGFKAGNVRDFCERWGKNVRSDGAARRRQPDDRRAPSSASCASCRPIPVSVFCRASSSAAEHELLCARLPVRHAPRHAVVHRRQRLVARRLRPVLGSQRRDPHRAVHANTAGCRSCRASRRSAGIFLSHDQIEAVLMRRAGYEVRVLPEEDGSCEENAARTARFRAARLALVPGQSAVRETRRHARHRLPTSRMQIALAIQMFVGLRGVVMFVFLAAIAVARWPRDMPFPWCGVRLLRYLDAVSMRRAEDLRR